MRKKYVLLFVLLSMGMLLGCLEPREYRELSKSEKRYILISERAVSEDGSILYRIEYKRDEYGNEKGRVAYDEMGKPDEQLLAYAYDNWGILSEFWTVESDGKSNGYVRIHEGYEFVYDYCGNLVTWRFYRDNELGVSQIDYFYESIKED